MIYQAFQTLQQFQDATNQTDLGGLIAFVSNTVPAFIPLLLFSFFGMISFGSYIIPKNLTGRGDFPASCAAAGYLTVIIATLLSLIPNVINVTTLLTTIIVAVLCTLWLYFSRQRG